MKQVYIGRDRQMLAICLALPTYSCGDCPSADNSLYLSRRTSTMREIQNVVCLNAFLLVPPKPHSRQPSLSVLLLGVANREVSQAEESARRLSGRYSLRLVPSTRHSVVSRHLPSCQSAAVSFSEARPQSMRRQKRTAPTTKPSAMR